MTVTTLEDAEKVAARPEDFGVRAINRAINILAHNEFSSPEQKALIDAKIKIMSDTVKSYLKETKDHRSAFAAASGLKVMAKNNPNPKQLIRIAVNINEPLTIKLKELAKQERRSISGQASFMLEKLLSEMR